MSRAARSRRLLFVSNQSLGTAMATTIARASSVAVIAADIAVLLTVFAGLTTMNSSILSGMERDDIDTWTPLGTLAKRVAGRLVARREGGNSNATTRQTADAQTDELVARREGAPKGKTASTEADAGHVQAGETPSAGGARKVSRATGEEVDRSASATEECSLGDRRRIEIVIASEVCGGRARGKARRGPTPRPFPSSHATGDHCVTAFRAAVADASARSNRARQSGSPA
jgi:hypothetical protein